MIRKCIYPIILIIGFSAFLAACAGLGENAALSTTQTAMSIQASQAALDIQSTQTSMVLEATQQEQSKLATRDAMPTETQVPTNTEPPPTETLTSTPEFTNTPEEVLTATETLTETPAEYLPTYTPTIVQGQERIRVENNSDENFSISLECTAGPCVGKNPSSYKHTYPTGVWYFYVWAGRYKITWTICGETETFQHALNGQWYIRIRPCP